MKIGITGATGFIGSELTRQALGKGYEVVCFSRSGAPAGSFPSGVEWRLFPSQVPLDVSGLDAVVHLAGESILGYWSSAKKQRIRQSRIDTTRQVVEGIAQATSPPGILISGSAIGFYGDTGEDVVTEHSVAGSGFLANVAKDWEAEAAKATGTRVVFLRTGFVIGRDHGAMRLIKPLFRAGLGGKLGNGRQWMSVIHVEDVAGLILHAVCCADVEGPLNAVMPHPVRNSDFTRMVATVAGRAAFLPAPGFILRLVLGEFSHLLLDSQRVSPEQAMTTGYHYRFPDLEAAMLNVFRH